MQDESIELLKILINISSSIFYTRKSNVSRIEDQKFYDKAIEDFLQESVITPLDKSLDSLSIQISNVLNIIPIYYKFLKNVEGLTMFDSAEIICIIKDINRFQKFSKLLSYAGFTPHRTKYNKRFHKLSALFDGRDSRWSLCESWKSRFPLAAFSWLSFTERHGNWFLLFAFPPAPW